jgi:uncharacterized protein involved in exopolysaccharide biosynthesis
VPAHARKYTAGTSRRTLSGLYSMSEMSSRTSVAVAPSIDEDEIDISRYARVLLRGWWLLLLFAVAGAAVGLVVSSRIPHRFEASTLLRVAPPRTGSNSVVGNAPAVLAVIQNRGVAASIVRDLGLDKPPHTLSAASFVDSALSVESVPNTNFIRLRVRLLDREAAVEAARRLADRVVSEAKNMAVEESAAFNHALEQQVTAARERLQTAEQQLFTYQQQAQIESLESQLNARLTQRSDTFALDAERARLKQAQTALATTPRTLTVKGGLDGASGGGTREVLNPAYDALEAQVVETTGRIAALEKSRDQLTANPPSAILAELYRKRQELSRLTTESDLARRFYADRARRYERARADATSGTDELRVIQPASAPDKPLSRKPAMLAGLGLTVGLVLASVAVLLRHSYADHAR